MKTRIAISSWGNIGRAAARVCMNEAKAADSDMELVGIIRRSAKESGDEGYPQGVQVAEEIGRLALRPDVVICAAPSHIVMEDVQRYLALGFSTVDCFDNHPEIPLWRERLDSLAKSNRAAAVISSGWDPGFDSVIRALTGLVAPDVSAVTTFGPGRSMGHTTTVKAIHPEIREAVALTLPGDKPGLQKREVYIALNDKIADSATQEKIRRDILAHDYFKNDETRVVFVPSIIDHDTSAHGGIITREGEAAKVEVKLHGGNAMMTAAAMYGAARAVGRAIKAGAYGCFTLAEIPPLDFIKGDTVRERLGNVKY